jgi:isoleucyl-tRNA synthetase
MICRVKIQQGYRVVFKPGSDCHGLPIEIKALEEQRKKLAEGRIDKESDEIPDQSIAELEYLKPIQIRRAARALATRTVKEQEAEFRQWGILADWENAWQTKSRHFVVKQLEVFQEMAKKGLIFRRYKPVYWSPSSKTALAEAELEYKNDHKSTAAYVKFPLTTIHKALRKKIENKLGGSSGLAAVIWTTTPWTLPANKAIAFSNDVEYSIIQNRQDLLIIAKSRLQDVINACFGGDRMKIVIDSFLGKELGGAHYLNPLQGRTARPQPLIHADFVSEESGSGLVHCAPGHGMDDYALCTSLGMEAVAPVDDIGCFTDAALPDDPSALEGISVLKGGSKAVLKLLGGDVLAVHNYKHKYPYDWRTKLPVIIRATEQWFADVGSVKDAALVSLEEVQFIPQSGMRRLQSFVKGRSEWCISRQRAWGVPIPALYTEDGKAVLTAASVAHIISVMKGRGLDAWWTDEPDEPAWILPGLEGNFRRGDDTMDVWFDSGSSWTQAEGRADVYIEGTDQHRGWFQSSLLTYIASGNTVAPFKTLITHGFTLDQKGKKMSKSEGNVIAPSQIMDGSLIRASKGGPQDLGVDALRLWAASSDYTRDVVIGEGTLKSNQSALLKYRMIIKMLLGSMQTHAEQTPISKLDRIALYQLQSVMAEVTTAYANFEFYKGVSAINRWINSDLSAFYLEALKDRLYCGDGGGIVEEIFHGLMRMLTPITPSLVAEAWEHYLEKIEGKKGISLERRTHPFHQILSDPLCGRQPEIFEYIPDDIPWLMNAHTAIKTALEKLRTLKMIGSSVQAHVVLSLPPKAHEVFSRYADELESIFVVSSVEIKDIKLDLTKFAAAFDAPGGRATAWVSQSPEAKCPRCWRSVAPVKDELCKRCDDVLYENPPPGFNKLPRPSLIKRDALGLFIKGELSYLKDVK